MNLLKRLFQKMRPKAEKKTPPDPRYMWDSGTTWGHCVRLFGDFEDGAETQRVVGWYRSKPRVGDYFRVPFGKGAVIFEFVSIEPCADPTDMFFGNVALLDYEKNLDLDEHVNPYSDKPGLRLI